MEYPSSFRILFSISHRASLIVLSSVRLFFESLLIYSLLLKEFCQNYNSCLSGIFVFLLVIWIYQAIVSKGFDETSAVILLKIDQGSFISPIWISNCLSTFVETIFTYLSFYIYKNFSFPQCIILVTLLKLNDCMSVALLLDFLFCSINYLSIYVSVLPCLGYCKYFYTKCSKGFSSVILFF